jgi:hypothetical protein
MAGEAIYNRQRAAGERHGTADRNHHGTAWSQKEAGYGDDQDVERCIGRADDV